MTDEQRAIWRRLTDEQRQRVIDAEWVGCLGLGEASTWVAWVEAVGEHCLYTATLERIRFEAAAFMTAWDRGQIPPADLIADLRQMQGAS